MMNAAEACDFFFVGAALLPSFLFLAEQPALATMAITFLFLAAAVCGIADPDAPHNRQDRPTP